MSTTDAGRVGEAKVLARLAETGWYPFADISGKCPVDILAWKGGRVIAIQVKSTSTQTPSGKWSVQIGSVRPNRNGNTIHKFVAGAQDYLAVYIAPTDTVVFIDSKTITAGRNLSVESVSGTEILEVQTG